MKKVLLIILYIVLGILVLTYFEEKVEELDGGTTLLLGFIIGVVAANIYIGRENKKRGNRKEFRKEESRLKREKKNEELEKQNFEDEKIRIKKVRDNLNT